jgi:hypothetical protein
MNTIIEAPRRCVNTPGVAQEIGLRMPVKATCSVEDCERSAHAHGWCTKHYTRWLRHGSVDDRVRAKPIDELFWASIDKSGPTPAHRPALGPCWTWSAFIDRDGYGLFHNRKIGTKRAHRLAYEMSIGPIPEGLVLDHLCRNRCCVRPSHLEPVTDKVNAERGMVAQKTHCIRGHEFTEKNTYIKVNGTRCCRACRNERTKTPENRAKHAEVERRRRARLRAEASGRGDAAARQT